jgi:hypothetical protein
LDVVREIVSHVAIENPEVGIESRGVVNFHWHNVDFHAEVTH